MFAPPPPLERLQNGRMARNVRRSETVAISASAASAKVGVIAAALVGPILSRIEGILSRVISVPLVVLWVVRPAEAGTQPKIRQFDVAVSVDQNVVRFNISVDEAHFVDALNGTDQFRYVKPWKPKNIFIHSSKLLHTTAVKFKNFSVPGKRFLENAQFDQKRHQVASGDVIHHKIQIVFILQMNGEKKTI